MEFRCLLKNGSTFTFEADGCENAKRKVADFEVKRIEMKIYRSDETIAWQIID